MQKIRDGYKLTKVGLLPQEWDVVKLDSVTDVRDGTHDTPKYVEQGIPFITSKNLKEYGIDYSEINYISEEDHEMISKRSRVDDGDILFAMIGTIGNPVIVKKEFDFSIKNVALVKCDNERILNVYLLNLLKSKIVNNQFAMKSNGGVQKFVSLGAIRSLLIPLPSLKEQQKIADILSTVDKKIEQTDALIEKTKELKKGLMQRLLTKGIGHTEFKDTEIGRIPVEWKVMQLSEVANINPNYKLNKGKTYDFVDMSSLPTEGLSIKEKELKKREYGANSGSKFRNGDILFARITPCAENGKMAYVDCLKTNYGLGSTEFIVISPKEDIILPIFLFYCMRSDRVRNYAISRMLGTTGRQRIPNEVFKEELKIALPSFEEQRRIIDLLYSLDTNICQYELKKKMFIELKNGLMSKLLTGKVRVRV